jgi:dihydroflavonol-4-reductase
LAHVVMIGGTGFLGWFTCRALVARGHAVTAVGLTVPDAGMMPGGVTLRAMDVDAADDATLADLLAGADVLIHAAGADGRNAFPAPAIEGFRARNVAPFHRLVPAMKAAGLRRLVVFGSFYTALDRLFPDLGIMQDNPYPLSRLEQARLAFALAGPGMDVAILELPWIFGAIEGRGTLWGHLIEAVRRTDGPVPVLPGGTACATAAQVADAAVGACEHATGHRHYPVCGANLSHARILEHVAAALGLSPRFVPEDAAEAERAALARRAALAARGIGSGYDPVAVARWNRACLHLDPLPAMEALGHRPDDLGAAIAAAVGATLSHGGDGPASRMPETTP